MVIYNVKNEKKYGIYGYFDVFMYIPRFSFVISSAKDSKNHASLCYLFIVNTPFNSHTHWNSPGRARFLKKLWSGLIKNIKASSLKSNYTDCSAPYNTVTYNLVLYKALQSFSCLRHFFQKQISYKWFESLPQALIF